MRELALNIEKMEHLESLGLDTSDARLYWESFPTDCGYNDYDGYHSTDPQDDANLLTYKGTDEDAVYTPAYSLDDILNKLPCEYRLGHVPNDSVYFGKLWIDDENAPDNSITTDDYIEATYHGNIACRFIGTSNLDVAYKMLEWCLKKKYIK